MCRKIKKKRVEEERSSRFDVALKKVQLILKKILLAFPRKLLHFQYIKAIIATRISQIRTAATGINHGFSNTCNIFLTPEEECIKRLCSCSVCSSEKKKRFFS